MIKVIVLGVVEGLTEFIPVSSTAHLLLVGKSLALPSGVFLEAISVAIQSGAILAAVWYFWRTIWKDRRLIGKVIVAFIPTAAVGLALYPLIKTLFASQAIIAGALIVGGIGLIAIKPSDAARDVSTISYKEAFLIGISQIASFIPGISRAGATLIGGSLLKIPRTVIVPFSFMLAIPTIIGASVVELRHVHTLSQGEWRLIALGGIIAFIVALATIRFFVTLLTTKSLAWFGWYRIALGVLILLVSV